MPEPARNVDVPRGSKALENKQVHPLTGTGQEPMRNKLGAWLPGRKATTTPVGRNRAKIPFCRQPPTYMLYAHAWMDGCSCRYQHGKTSPPTDGGNSSILFGRAGAGVCSNRSRENFRGTHLGIPAMWQPFKGLLRFGFGNATTRARARTRYLHP